MQEVQALCDRVIIINQGKLVADKKLSELQELHGSKLGGSIRLLYFIKRQHLGMIAIYKKNFSVFRTNCWLCLDSTLCPAYRSLCLGLSIS